MKRIYSTHDGLIAGFLKTLLENAGISCLLRNEHLGGAAGQVPPTECWQEIWITDEADYAQAEQLLHETLKSGHEERPWACPDCGEHIEAQFGRCWNCGSLCPQIA